MFALRTLAIAAALLLLTNPSTPADTKPADAKVRVLIIDGQNNHAWQMTTPYLKKALEDCGRFSVEVATSPAKPKAPTKPKDDKDEKAQAKYQEELAKFKEQEAKYKDDMAKFQCEHEEASGVWSAGGWRTRRTMTPETGYFRK